LAATKTKGQNDLMAKSLKENFNAQHSVNFSINYFAIK
jgi:hypothetical protein